MTRTKKGHVTKTCKGCSKRLSMHKRRVTCSKPCAAKYAKVRQKHFLKRRSKR